MVGAANGLIGVANMLMVLAASETMAIELKTARPPSKAGLIGGTKGIPPLI